MDIFRTTAGVNETATTAAEPPATSSPTNHRMNALVTMIFGIGSAFIIVVIAAIRN